MLVKGGPDSKVHVASMGANWVPSAPGGPHVPYYQGREQQQSYKHNCTKLK